MFPSLAATTPVLRRLLGRGNPAVSTDNVELLVRDPVAVIAYLAHQVF